ncbi:hypothetical protein Tco_1155818 [Tanacetum coccineum]
MLRAFPMSPTGVASRWLRTKPSGSIKTWEDLKAKFLSKVMVPPDQTAKKMMRSNNFRKKPDETIYQAWERFKELLRKFHQHYITEMQEVILFYNGLKVPTRQILDFKGAIPNKTAVDAKVAIQEMAEYSQNGTTEHLGQKWDMSYERRQSMEELLSRFMNELAQIHEENSNLIKEIQASINVAIKNRASIKKGSYGLKDLDAYSIGTTLRNGSLPKKEKYLGSFTLPCYINNVCFEKALADLGSSVSVMPLSTYINLVGIAKFVFPIDFIILDMLEDVNVPLILRRSFFSTAHAKVDVFKRKITLRVGDEKIIFKSVKPASSLIKRVYMLSLRERMDLYLKARLMGETLILNRSLDPLYGDYIELNDLNEPLELRRNQVDDLEPTIEEGGVVNKPMIDIVKTRSDFIVGLDDYPSECDFDRRIHIDCAYNLKFSCMIGFEGRNELGNFVNAPVFIGNFYVITDFTVVEDMGPYLDEGMGDTIVGEPFARLRV